MKFIYFAIIGLILFNGILVATAPIFNSELESGAINVTNPDTGYGNYSLSNSTNVLGLIFSDNALGAWGAFSAIAIIGIIGAILLKNYVIVAVAIFLGIVTGLYVGAVSIFINIYHNVYFDAIVALTGVVMGILVIYNVIEMFSGTAGDV